MSERVRGGATVGVGEADTVRVGQRQVFSVRVGRFV